MRKTLLIISFITLSLFVFAQENTKQKEIGLAFYNLNDFGLSLKTGTNKSLWRFTTLFISGRNSDESSDSLITKYSNVGFGLKVGKEFRKSITDNLEFRFGADVSFSYRQTESDYNDKTIDDHDRLTERKTCNPGINLVLGVNYVLNDNFVIGAEFLPNFSYQTGTSINKSYYENNGDEIKSDISGFNYGLSNTSVMITLAYRF